MYIDAMAAAGFSPDTPLFVATGLLSYGAETEFKVGWAWWQLGVRLRAAERAWMGGHW